MSNKPIHIKFQNQQNPSEDFDIVELEYLFQKKDLKHSPEHLHLVEFFILLFIKEGEGHHTIDFTNYKCKKGTIITIRKNQIHKFVKSDKMKGTLLLFTNDFLESYLEKLEAQKTLQLFNELLCVPKIQLSEIDYNEVSDSINRIQNEYFKKKDSYSMGIIRSELHILIAKLFRIKSKKNKIVFNRKYLNEFIELQNLVEKNITKTSKVIDYAKDMGLSTKTLNTITRSIIHKSAKEFIDEIYSKQIKRLLTNTDHSIKEIAYLSGFEETTNFYKFFKRQTSLTPEQYRSSIK